MGRRAGRNGIAPVSTRRFAPRRLQVDGRGGEDARVRHRTDNTWGGDREHRSRPRPPPRSLQLELRERSNVDAAPPHPDHDLRVVGAGRHVADAVLHRHPLMPAAANRARLGLSRLASRLAAAGPPATLSATTTTRIRRMWISPGPAPRDGALLHHTMIPRGRFRPVAARARQDGRRPRRRASHRLRARARLGPRRFTDHAGRD